MSKGDSHAKRPRSKKDAAAPDSADMPIEGEGITPAPETPPTIVARIRHLPKCPGVYLFKDREGRVLYVGKAKDLRSRVASYFQNADELRASRGPHILRMVKQIADVDFLDCETDVDAMLKEARLIKDIQPPFNKQLRDEKTFPYLEITPSPSRCPA